MSLSTASKVGSIIAGIANEQSSMKNSMLPEEVHQSLLLTPIDTSQVSSSVTVYKRYYKSDSFILDHPVYGELDSSSLKLDGGYELAGDQFPIGFPITFNEKKGKIIYYTYTG